MPSVESSCENRPLEIEHQLAPHIHTGQTPPQESSAMSIRRSC